jgi:ABC-type sugar transport system ATPase subunit
MNPKPITLDDVVARFRQDLYLHDLGALYVVLATIHANRLKGPPVWIVLVGAASSGKSTLLSMLRDLEKIYQISTCSSYPIGSTVIDPLTKSCISS